MEIIYKEGHNFNRRVSISKTRIYISEFDFDYDEHDLTSLSFEDIKTIYDHLVKEGKYNGNI